jgi:hypothetical protein
MPIPERVYVPAAKDPGKGHFYVSLIKSVLRLAGCLFAAYTGSVVALAIFFAVAEILGIAEELV